MAYIGLDLTDPHARKPRPVDVAIVDMAGNCVFERLPALPGSDTAAWLAPITHGPNAGDVLIVDGPLALASLGNSLRNCERVLGTPGKTPDSVPRAGTRPFAGYIAGSVRLASRLVADGWTPVTAATPVESATLLEAYPGASWRKLVNGPLPHKTTHAGLRARESVLRALGLSFSRPPASHDELDAALCAWIGWRSRTSAGTASTVGTPCFELGGHLREGVIVDVPEGVARIAATSEGCTADARRSSASRPRDSIASPRSTGGAAVLPNGIEADWVYFANPTKADRSETAELALTEEILWRKAHNSAGRLCANVGNVAVGDVILLAYSEGAGHCSAIGTFKVMEPVNPVPGAAALNRFSDEKLSARLAESQYAVDQRLGVHTGFLVETLWVPAQGEAVSVVRPAGNNAIWRAVPRV